MKYSFDQILLFVFRSDLLTSREKMKRQNRLHMVTMVDRLVKTEKELDRVMML